MSKSIALVSRINLFWGLRWKAIPEHVGPGQKVEDADIVISCVDTRVARATIERLVTGNANVSYHLDLGNGATGGQFVLGQPLNCRSPGRAHRIRTAAELFPEIMDTSLREDDAPSCSALAALETQEPFVNQTLASHELAVLARLFRHGGPDVHGAFVNVGQQQVQPIVISRPVKFDRPVAYLIMNSANA